MLYKTTSGSLGQPPVPLAREQHGGPNGLWAHPEAADLAPQTALWPAQCASSTHQKTFLCTVSAHKYAVLQWYLHDMTCSKDSTGFTTLKWAGSLRALLHYGELCYDLYFSIVDMIALN